MFIILLGIALLSGLVWVASISFIHQLVNPESVFVFDFDIFGLLSISVFGLIGLMLAGLPYRLAEVFQNKKIIENIKLCWLVFAFFAFVGVTINYTNYFVNIKGEGLVECDFHVQRHRDWLLQKYARTQEDCGKDGVRNVSTSP